MGDSCHVLVNRCPQTNGEEEQILNTDSLNPSLPGVSRYGLSLKTQTSNLIFGFFSSKYFEGQNSQDMLRILELFGRPGFFEDFRKY